MIYVIFVSDVSAYQHYPSWKKKVFDERGIKVIFCNTQANVEFYGKQTDRDADVVFM